MSGAVAAPEPGCSLAIITEKDTTKKWARLGQTAVVVVGCCWLLLVVVVGGGCWLLVVCCLLLVVVCRC